jgi:thermostable 8-oxoguanine DNA glycosylase
VGKFSEEGKRLYYLKREDVDDALQEVNHKIENRKPTWWEEAKGVLNTFIVKVMANMPDLMRILLEKAATSIRLPFLRKITKIFRLPHFGKQ